MAMDIEGLIDMVEEPVALYYLSRNKGFLTNKTRIIWDLYTLKYSEVKHLVDNGNYSLLPLIDEHAFMIYNISKSGFRPLSAIDGLKGKDNRYQNIYYYHDYLFGLGTRFGILEQAANLSNNGSLSPKISRYLPPKQEYREKMSNFFDFLHPDYQEGLELGVNLRIGLLNSLGMIAREFSGQTLEDQVIRSLENNQKYQERKQRHYERVS